ncbi:MAG: radical SAM protein [Spirochaetes bacterium]|nr:radical SAM protein [Spirochaetota bacterium]
MKILFIQLPLTVHSCGYIAGNVEYASAVISGNLHARFGKKHEYESLPFILSSFASDSVILKYLENVRPDIIAFTSYLWNIERSLEIAEKIKSLNSEIKIIFGGPEINSGSAALQKKRGYIDSFVTGEGEWFFGRYLSGLDLARYTKRLRGNHIIVQPEDELVPPGRIFDPLSGKRLSPMLDGSVFIELARGCPYRCAYCLYSKNYKIIREMPFKVLTDAVTLEGVKEIYILSPAFNCTSGFTDRLKTLAGVNKGVALHSEMRAAGIDASTAGLLFDAGFRSMEVGLQTMNAGPLKEIGRNTDPEEELKGILLLKEKGLDLKIGIIPGLPGDTHDGFIKTIDRLIALGLGENIELYPLMLLPGTSLRERAVAEGIEFQHKPPYYYLGGWGMSFNEMVDITRYFEDATGFSHDEDILPDFSSSESGGYCKGVRFNGDDPAEWDGRRYENIIDTNVFSFHIYFKHAPSATRGLRSLLRHLNDGGLFNIIFYTEEAINEKLIGEILIQTEKENLTRRLNVFGRWPDGLSVRIYHVYENPAISDITDEYAFIKPIYMITETNLSSLKVLDAEKSYLVAAGLFGKSREKIIKSGIGPESIAFEDEDESFEFYREKEYEYIKYPFSFRIEDYRPI